MRIALAQINATVGDIEGNSAGVSRRSPPPRRPTSCSSPSSRSPAIRPRTCCSRPDFVDRAARRARASSPPRPTASPRSSASSTAPTRRSRQRCGARRATARSRRSTASACCRTTASSTSSATSSRATRDLVVIDRRRRAARSRSARTSGCPDHGRGSPQAGARCRAQPLGVAVPRRQGRRARGDAARARARQARCGSRSATSSAARTSSSSTAARSSSTPDGTRWSRAAPGLRGGHHRRRGRRDAASIAAAGGTVRLARSRRLRRDATEVYGALVLGPARLRRARTASPTWSLGLSGGIDSALVAALACRRARPRARALRADARRRYSSRGKRRRRARARRQPRHRRARAADRGRRSRRCSARSQPAFGALPADLTEENLQARIRGTLLMALSNKFGWLVLTTGNKSEMSVGYSTLYGDMAGGFALIKDVSKTLVYGLARWRNAPAGAADPGVDDRAAAVGRAARRTSTTTRTRCRPTTCSTAMLEAYVEHDRCARGADRRAGFDARRGRARDPAGRPRRVQAPPGRAGHAGSRPRPSAATGACRSRIGIGAPSEPRVDARRGSRRTTRGWPGRTSCATRRSSRPSASRATTAGTMPARTGATSSRWAMDEVVGYACLLLDAERWRPRPTGERLARAARLGRGAGAHARGRGRSGASRPAAAVAERARDRRAVLPAPRLRRR